MTCGIPQASSLGPVLFLIYINDLPNCSNALTFRIFADDTNVFASARNLKDLEEIVNSELKKVKIWCDVNRLSINFTKTNFMIIKSSKKKDDQVSIKIECADGTIRVLLPPRPQSQGKAPWGRGWVHQSCQANQEYPG